MLKLNIILLCLFFVVIGSGCQNSETSGDSRKNVDEDVNLNDEINSDSDSDSDGDGDMDSDSDGDADSHGDADSDADSDGDADSDSDADGDSDSDSDGDSDSDSDTDTDTDTDTDSDSDADADGDSDTDADTDADSDADTDADSDSDSDTDADNDSDSDSDSEEGYYFIAGDWSGYAWTGTGDYDGGTVSAITSDWTSGDGAVCIEGELELDYSSLGVLGMSVAQEKGTESGDEWSPGSDYSGVYVDISKRIDTTVRMELLTDGDTYCAEVPAGGVTLRWSDFATECWGEAGTTYNGAVSFDSIQLYAPGDQNESVEYDFCLNELYPVEGSVVEPDTERDTGFEPPTCSEGDRQACSTYEVGNHCGLTYEIWTDGSAGCMTNTSYGFTAQWDQGNANYLARKGVRPGSASPVVTYSADYNPNGNSYLGIYGWTENPLIEYYILDSWGTWRPPNGNAPGTGAIGTVETDGGVYDIYRSERVNKPSIHGNTTFWQYWSVRQEKRTSGTITVEPHFRAWEAFGLTMGSFYEVSLVVEGYQSSGTADVTVSFR